MSYSVRDADLAQEFSAFGSVQSTKVMMKRDTDRYKGFSFVEMGSAQMKPGGDRWPERPADGRPRNLVVNEARPMEPRPPRSGSGFDGGYGGGRRRY